MGLLGQYGKRMPLGRGGGYKKVSGDGKGKSVYRDYDPVSGILREITFHGDGTFTTRRWQNVEALKDYAKVVGDHFKKHSKKSMQQQVVIPVIEHTEIMKRCGWKPGTDANDFDHKKFDRIINDSNEPVFKTRPGRISIDRAKWY